MKQILVLLLISITVTCFSQTTEEEYNYCMYGYEIMIKSGLDMKKGYFFEDFASSKSDKYFFQVKVLMREKTKEPAAVLIISKDITRNKNYYDCIPLGSYKFGSTIQNFQDWDKEMIFEYANVLKGFLGTAIDDINLYEKLFKKNKNL